MKVIIEPKQEERIIAPATQGTKISNEEIRESLRTRAEHCVNHLCGCNCGC